jgi:hypothetical protein
MAHFAKLDENNLVLEVHVVNNDALDPTNEEISGVLFLTEWSGGHPHWKQTSYNATIRKNYASVGSIYHGDLDAFVPPKCHDEANLDESTCLWVCANLEHYPDLED